MHGWVEAGGRNKVFDGATTSEHSGLYRQPPPGGNTAFETCGDPAKAIEWSQQLHIPQFACRDVCTVGAIVGHLPNKRVSVAISFMGGPCVVRSSLIPAII